MLAQEHRPEKEGHQALRPEASVIVIDLNAAKGKGKKRSQSK